MNINGGGERIFRFDNIKAVLIVLVVFGHIISYNTIQEASEYRSVFMFIYSFHMPLFIFISGFFHKNKNIKNKVIYFLVLGMLLRILVYIVNNLILGTTGSLSFISTDGCAWFLFAMAAYIGLAYLFRNYNPVLVLVLALILGCFSGYDQDIGDLFVLSRIIVFFPFYWAGYCAGSKKWLSVFSDSSKHAVKAAEIMLSLAVLGIWIYFCFFHLEDVYELRPFFTGRHSYGEMYADSFSGLLIRLLCYAITTLTGLAVIILIPDRKLPAVTTLGERSLAVYFWHRPVLFIFDYFGIFDSCFMADGSLLLCLALAAALSAVLGQKVFHLPFEYLKNAILKNKKQDSESMNNAQE